jgi:hypothetical protein
MRLVLLSLTLTACTGAFPDLKLGGLDSGDTGGIDDTGETGADVDWTFEIADQGGCGDTFLWAVNEAETQGFVFQLNGAVAQSFAEAAPLDVPVDLSMGPGDSAAIEGTALRSLQCNDAVTEGPEETHRWAVIEGVGTLHIEPDLSAEVTDYYMPAEATVSLSGLSFVDGEGQRQDRDELVITGQVGWFPG